MRRRDHVVCLLSFPELHLPDQLLAKDSAVPRWSSQKLRPDAIVNLSDWWPQFSFSSKSLQQTLARNASTKTELFHDLHRHPARKEGLLHCEANIQHYSKADNLWACFKIAEWGVFCHLRTLQTHPTRFNQVQSDSTQIIECVAAESNTAINFVCEGYVFTSL